MPEFYASDEYMELVNITYAGDESLAQAAAWGSLLSEDSLCNLVGWALSSVFWAWKCVSGVGGWVSVRG